MKKFVAICAVLVLMLAVSGVAQATIVQRTYTFTGADLINNVFDSTARYSDGSLKVYEGMRQIGPASGTAVGATFLTGSYLTNFNSSWNTAVTNNRVLNYVQFSGMDGVAGQWGEDYKPYEWVSGTGPTGWVFEAATYPSPKAGSLTDKVPTWTAPDGEGLALTGSGLANQIFTVTIKFDTANMWWGNPSNYLYGANTAPNSLDGLTIYFASYFSQGETLSNRYVGNMFIVPEPATMCLLALGGLLLRRKK
ncbi:MAG: PEP-CTERM sorting domain-containing protein [Phycisphaerae bacterium]|jgi:hypothetical protein